MRPPGQPVVEPEVLWMRAHVSEPEPEDTTEPLACADLGMGDIDEEDD